MLTNLRPLRKQRGLSMKQLGEMVGVAEVTISTYENGRSDPSIPVLCKLADVLDVSLDMLVRGKEKTFWSRLLVRIIPTEDGFLPVFDRNDNKQLLFSLIVKMGI